MPVEGLTWFQVFIRTAANKTESTASASHIVKCNETIKPSRCEFRVAHSSGRSKLHKVIVGDGIKYFNLLSVP